MHFFTHIGHPTCQIAINIKEFQILDVESGILRTHVSMEPLNTLSTSDCRIELKIGTDNHPYHILMHFFSFLKKFFFSLILSTPNVKYPQKSAYLHPKDPVKITDLHKLFSLQLREAGNGRIALRITTNDWETLE